MIKLVNQMEDEQEGDEIGHHKFMDVHMYLTAALQRTDMRAIALQTAIDILHKKVTTLIFNFVFNSPCCLSPYYICIY